MLKNNFKLSRIVFEGSENYYEPIEDKHERPSLPIEIEYRNCENKENSITVKIDELILLPSQLEYLLKEVAVYKEAIKHEID